MKTLIIAEAGVNHNGSMILAKKLINTAAKIGADVIKFQFYNSSQLTIRGAKLANYQRNNLQKKITQFDMLKKYEFGYEEFKKIINYCKQKKIKFLASAFDINSIKLLKKLKVDTFKIPSGEITNYSYLSFIGKLNKKIIISSGLSNLKEIKEAVNLLHKNGTHKSKITVLHCNTDYPTKINDVNLRAMITIKNQLGINVGYSDHSNDMEVPIVAVSLGAKIIEKHLTLSNKLVGPDHKASLEPKNFRKMIKNIRNTEIILGSSEKKITNSEKKNLIAVRKSLVANQSINKGELIKLEYLTAKRPGNGINPMKIKNIIGTRAKKNYLKDDQIIL